MQVVSERRGQMRVHWYAVNPKANTGFPSFDILTPDLDIDGSMNFGAIRQEYGNVLLA